MVTLTQEKREELANYARARLASHVVHGGCSDEEEIFKIALALLTAETIGRVNLGEISDDNEYPDAKVECTHPEADWGNFQDGFLLFTAPPVPEIKLIDPADFIRKWKNSDDCPLAGLSAKSAANKAVLAYAQEIKRLNGLGE